MSKGNKKTLMYCDFCGAHESEVDMILTGLEANICNKCIEKGYKIVSRELASKAAKFNLKLIKPKDIFAFLNDYVIGQEEAKKTLSVAVYNHFKRITSENKKGDVELEKSNILMVGDTGTGKTLLAKTIAKIINVPFCIADATVLTESGYVGEDVESVLSKLYQAADFNKEAAERGIVFIDEIDKISRKGDNPSITRDVSGEGVQQGLLKLLEGSIVGVPPHGGRKHPDQPLVQINTKNILFICGGAFEGLDKIINSRLSKQNIGFKTNNKSNLDLIEENPLKYVMPQDLRKFGIIPELLGRMPVITYLDKLDAQALRRILTEPKNAIIKQYQKLFELDGVKMEINEDALEIIVKTAEEYNLGARGLRSICEVVFKDAMFEAPSLKSTQKLNILNIDADYVQKKLDLWKRALGKAA